MRVNPLKWEKIPTTVQPPVSDHPKCEDLVVDYRRWLLTRFELQRDFSDKWSRHTGKRSTFWKRII